MPTMNSALVNKIKNNWCQETAHPAYASRWSKDNPSAGQCLVTALLIQDELGGDIYDCKVGRSRHFYNVVNGEKIDLTFDQFPAGSECKDDRIRDRKSLLSNADTRQRYELLKELVNSNNGINESYQEDKAVQRFGRECREDGLDFFDYEEFSMLIGHNGITPNDHLYRVYVDAYMGNSDSDKSRRDDIGQVLDILYDLSTDEIMEILGNPGSSEVDPHSPMFIIPNGQIVSVGDVTGDHNLGVHIDLFTELIDRIAEQNGLNVPKAEDDDAKLPMEHSLDKLNWARVNCGETWGEDRFYCVLPDTLTNAQARSIEKWLEWGYDSHKERVLIYINNEYIYYYFKDNFPEDIIKKIKRYYSSGRLYENGNELEETMSTELEDRAKKHKKKSKGLGWYKGANFNSNAGDVEKGIEVFNNAQPDGGAGPVNAMNGNACCEDSSYETYHYAGPVYYAGHKIAEKSNEYTSAPSINIAIRNILYKVAKGAPDLYNYDIVDELVKPVPVMSPKERFNPTKKNGKCMVCGYHLNDAGECPVCDYGEYDLLESITSLEALWRLSNLDE